MGFGSQPVSILGFFSIPTFSQTPESSKGQILIKGYFLESFHSPSLELRFSRVENPDSLDLLQNIGSIPPTPLIKGGLKRLMQEVYSVSAELRVPIAFKRRFLFPAFYF